jgi:hypothetical protein
LLFGDAVAAKVHCDEGEGTAQRDRCACCGYDHKDSMGAAFEVEILDAMRNWAAGVSGHCCSC